MQFGDLTLTPLWDGSFRLDGGAMFGVVPKPLWEKRAPADERNRIRLGLRPLLSGSGREDAPHRRRDRRQDGRRRASTSTPSTDRATSITRLPMPASAANDIDIVLASHLHFDHAGGFTARDAPGNCRAGLPARALHRPHRLSGTMRRIPTSGIARAI